MKLANGCAMSNTGYRLIVFRQDGGLAPIVGSRDKGYRTECGTLQQAVAGDIVALNKWDRHEQRLYLLRITQTLDVPMLGMGCPAPEEVDWELLWEGPAEAAFARQPGAPDMEAFASFLDRTGGRTSSYLNSRWG